MKCFNLSYTALDESRRLIECGVGQDTADMTYKRVLNAYGLIYEDMPVFGSPIDIWLSYYYKTFEKYGKESCLSVEDYCVGCWSLGKLVMILSEKRIEFGYTFSMDEKTVRIMEKTKNGISSNYFIGGILIESVVSAIVWLYNKKRK